MITAPNVFATDTEGTYTLDVAVDWVGRHGTPSPLYLGRTLRFSPQRGWEFGPASAEAKEVWKPLDDAPKTLRSALGNPDDLPTMSEGFQPDQAAYYELIGPKIAKNPHALEQPTVVRHGLLRTAEERDFEYVPTTSLWALVRNWFTGNDYQGILWTWHDEGDEWPQHAVVRRDRLPQVG